MSRVSFFQRFSQQENHATNNTLLMLRYLYEASPARLQKLLTSMLDVDLAVGLSFDQQVKTGQGVPDALISQEQLRIFVETKTHGELDAAQLHRHFKGMSAAEKRTGDFLVGLTTESLSEGVRQALFNEAAGYGITFVSLTFSSIVEALKQEYTKTERDLLAVIEDYEAYLTEARLLGDRNRFVVFPCGTSITENAKFSLYYEPPSRRLASNCRYLGVYKQKAVKYVGVINTVAVATTGSDDSQQFIEEVGQLSGEQKGRIAEVIKSTKYYDLAAEPFRFYLADRLFPTQFSKTSSGGIRGRTYPDLSKLIPSYDSNKNYTSEEIATLLDGKTWE